MNDFEICKSILVDGIYKDKVHFELELNKISDRKLAQALIFEVYSKLEKYGADKEIIKSILPIFFDHTTNAKEVAEYVKDVLVPGVSSLPESVNEKGLPSNTKTLNKFLKIVQDCDKYAVGETLNIKGSPEFEEGVRSLTEKELDQFKNFLLKMEAYEMVAEIDRLKL